MVQIFKEKKVSMDIEDYDSFNNFDAAVDYDKLTKHGKNDCFDILESDSLERNNQNNCLSLDLVNNSISQGFDVIGNIDSHSLNYEKNSNSNYLTKSENFVNSIIQNIHNVDHGKKKGEVLDSLFDQLNDLEKLIKNAKRELIKYEKSGAGN